MELRKNIFIIHIPPPPPRVPHTYDFVVLTHLTHPSKKVLVVKIVLLLLLLIYNLRNHTGSNK
jgi:uncharacterized integral membrane protein